VGITQAADCLNVISGFARGVDLQAHLGALQAGGTTSIVLANGILEFSPGQLAGEFDLEREAVVISQFAPKEIWRARNAMTRNHLVCGLARAVVVIEAGKEKDAEGKMSGTFAAAQSALEKQVPLFVIQPTSLEAAPPGNATLIDRSAIPIDANAMGRTVREWLDANAANATSSGRIQAALFK
jgi:predicted Rossmann fold nucleotide-binding protein DprA/Smf involved in DNA uptake